MVFWLIFSLKYLIRQLFYSERVSSLSAEQLEELGEALLDFSEVADLEVWLNQQNYASSIYKSSHFLKVAIFYCNRRGSEDTE
ncbi:DUF4351 domain-containing protein [Nostoc sp. FACHB-190]|nr:DUF4351 domain-containing protein [Nostoc sp. FACHB-190]